MTNGKDGRGGHREDAPTRREISQQQARENAEALRDTRRSHTPGIADDSDVVQSAVGALGAPVEGAVDSIRERERAAARGKDPGADEVGGVSGRRAQDVSHDGSESRATVPTRPEDAEAEPGEIAEDMSRDRPGTRRGDR